MNQNPSSQDTVRRDSYFSGNISRAMSLQTRMLWTFILLSVLPVLIAGTVAGFRSTQGVRTEVFHRLDAIATLKEGEIKTLLKVLQTNIDLISEDQTLQQGIVAILQDTMSDAGDKVFVRYELVSFNEKTGYFTEIFIMDRDGKIILSTDPNQEDKIQVNQEFFKEGLQGAYVAPPAYEVGLSNYSIVISQPIKNRSGRVVGVLAGRVNLSTLNEIMQVRGGLGDTGETYLVSANYAVLTDLRHVQLSLGETYIRTDGVNDVIRNKTQGSATYENYTDTTVIGVYRWIPELQVALVAESEQSEALQVSNTVFRTTLESIFITVVIAIVLSFMFSRTITTPITNLVSVAENIARGNLTLRAEEAAQKDEIGVLAHAFNTMTERLRDLIGTLEQRVAERTQALSSVAEISTTASTSLETDKLLQQVVDLSKDRFDFYHAHIYLLDEAGASLVLSAGAGAVGRQMVAKGHSIPLDREQSLVARAARERKGVTINDVTTAPDFLPNPLLPDTRSELAVPMMAGDEVIGVFDVQSDMIGRFSESDIAVQTTLASQVASAVQNARSYTELQQNQILLSDALKAARLGNWEYDFEKDLFSFTDEFYSIFRTNAERVGGYKISSADYAKNFVHPDDAPLVGIEIQKVLDAKDHLFTTHLEHRIIFPDGEIGYIAVNINVERDENGKITRWYGANQDITERRRLEEFNRERARQQEAINLITQKIQSATTVESALQITARELGRALGQKPTLVTLDPTLSDKAK